MDKYNPANTYQAGALCIYDGLSYICLEDGATGTFDPDKWERCTIAQVLDQKLNVKDPTCIDSLNMGRRAGTIVGKILSL